MSAFNTTDRIGYDPCRSPSVFIPLLTLTRHTPHCEPACRWPSKPTHQRMAFAPSLNKLQWGTNNSHKTRPTAKGQDRYPEHESPRLDPESESKWQTRGLSVAIAARVQTRTLCSTEILLQCSTRRGVGGAKCWVSFVGATRINSCRGGADDKST